MLIFWIRLFMLVGALSVLSSCECYEVACAPCPPPVTFTLHNEVTQIRLEEVVSSSMVTATRADGGKLWVSCDSVGCYVESSDGPNEPGAYTIVIRVPGYVEKAHEVIVQETANDEGCCSCGYAAKTVDIGLTPIY